MKLFLKRAGFLLLMLVLGVLSLIVHTTGYPFAWRFSSDQAYWLPLAYGLDVLCVIAVLALVFWGLRGFLFGRGRPWLAWLSISAWAVVWVTYTWHELGAKTPYWGPRLYVGASALHQKVADLQQRSDSPDVIKALPEAQRQAVCGKAVLKKESRITAELEGLPMAMYFPADMADKGLFDADSCPAERVQQHKKIVSLEAQLKASLDQDVGDLLKVAAQLALLGHPDAVVQMYELHKKNPNDPVAQEIALKEFQLRLHTNGQVQDHQWEEMPGQSSAKVKTTSVNPRIWRHGKETDGDTWNFWVRLDLADGDVLQNLWVADCKNRTLQLTLYIARSAQGKVTLEPVSREAEKVTPGTSGEDWLNKVCSGKDKQVRLPDEVAKQKFGG